MHFYGKAMVDTLYMENLYKLLETSLACLVLTNSSDIYLERYAARRGAVASTPRRELELEHSSCSILAI